MSTLVNPRLAEEVEGSGTCDLAGISGTATFRAPHGEAAIVEFDVQLP